MRTSTRLVVAACTVLLATACANPMVKGFRATPCNPGVCKLTVTVEDCAAGKLKVVPEDVSVFAAQNLEWTMDTPDFEFLTDGISIPSTDFVRMGVTGSGKKFIVHDRHNELGAFKYTVRVKKSGGPACAPYDPTISNE